MNDNNNFFNKPDMNPQDQPNQDPQMVTVGDKQYTQDEVNRLVELGQVATEMETKWNRKVDDLYPEFTRRSQRLSEVEEQNRELQAQVEANMAAQAQSKLNNGAPLNDEEQARVIKEQAEKFGILTSDKFEELYQSRRAQEQEQQLAKNLIGEVNEFVEQQASEGKPRTTAADLIAFMDDNGYQYDGSKPTYERAYKEMYEKELDDWKLQSLKRNQPSGLYTTSQSSSASVPEEKRVTSENLGATIRETLSRF